MKKLIWLMLFISSYCLIADGIRASYIDVSNEFFEEPNPLSQKWDKAASVTVDLYPQTMTEPKIKKAGVNKVRVKALHNKEWLSVRMVWDDKAKNDKVSSTYDTDACAVQFPVESYHKTPFFMGSKEVPVSILHWKALWQKDIDVHYQETSDLFPNIWVDTYMFGTNVALKAGNPMTQLHRKQPAETLIAKGFGSLTSQKIQDIKSKGIWKNGKWYVVFSKTFEKSNPIDAEIRLGRRSGLAFAVWDGSHHEVGARKSYAPWVPFELEQKVSGAH